MIPRDEDASKATDPYRVTGTFPDARDQGAAHD